jgi:hypothetical protein
MDTTTVADAAVAVDSALIDIGLVLLGSLLTLAGYFVKALLDRRTEASNRIFEMRLETVDRLWRKYNSLIWIIGKSGSIGYEEWRENYFNEAEEIRKEFRMEVERQQIILGKDIVDKFLDIGMEAMRFSHGFYENEHGNPITYNQWYNEKLSSKLSDLSSVVNRSLQSRTHTIELKFRGEEE